MYAVATISRMLKYIGLFAEYKSLLYSSFAKEAYIFENPTNRNHPVRYLYVCVSDFMCVWRGFMCACVCACMCVCVCARVEVRFCDTFQSNVNIFQSEDYMIHFRVIIL